MAFKEYAHDPSRPVIAKSNVMESMVAKTVKNTMAVLSPKRCGSPGPQVLGHSYPTSLLEPKRMSCEILGTPTITSVLGPVQKVIERFWFRM